MRGCVIELLCDWVNCCLAGFGRGCKHLPKKDIGLVSPIAKNYGGLVLPPGGMVSSSHREFIKPTTPY